MKEKKNALLPLGSIVYLEKGTVKLMVVGRGAVFNDDIDKVVFRGYEDEEEQRYLEVYQDWEKNLDIPKKSN
ncbi:DUF4176 domain-containing protein [Ligilactobacillus acidipiscis]|uniref:DUF4176 domain-containing protein n=1 Tax=Ligilactobacillus acidipiscis TaxID=89059 RepID=UPI0023F88875|nr:DUF4176 domain-containing protein [Ligilactobacillus acidipiscis]WEV56395.1 DUF4176 domain-containing protein [Ligilactobacillus acidipiscis]